MVKCCWSVGINLIYFHILAICCKLLQILWTTWLVRVQEYVPEVRSEKECKWAHNISALCSRSVRCYFFLVQNEHILSSWYVVDLCATFVHEAWSIHGGFMHCGYIHKSEAEGYSFKWLMPSSQFPVFSSLRYRKAAALRPVIIVPQIFAFVLSLFFEIFLLFTKLLLLFSCYGLSQCLLYCIINEHSNLIPSVIWKKSLRIHT